MPQLNYGSEYAKSCGAERRCGEEVPSARREQAATSESVWVQRFASRRIKALSVGNEVKTVFLPKTETPRKENIVPVVCPFGSEALLWEALSPPIRAVIPVEQQRARHQTPVFIEEDCSIQINMQEAWDATSLSCLCITASDLLFFLYFCECKPETRFT